jgi:hypothetical protein
MSMAVDFDAELRSMNEANTELFGSHMRAY